MSTRLRVRRTGPQSLVEDLGRRGLSTIGVGRSGAADRASLRLANRMVANPDGAPALEVTLGGLEVEVTEGVAWVCVTGAPAPVHVDGREVGPGCVVAVRQGSVLRLGQPTAGLRSYVAVRGGLAVPAVLGSSSHDVLSGLGPAPLAEGDELLVGEPPDRHPDLDHVPVPSISEEVVLQAVRGPRDDWVTDVQGLVERAWTASERTNRVGMRLTGGRLDHAAPDRQLPSEGALRGAVQVPPSGEPVVFLADHPVTGGYPVVAVVVDADVDRAAQVRPGQTVRFAWVEQP
jgi:biotin-dependent carboxylase-like uncharacterized protein